jgi:Protein of unknown function (DUF2846)
VDCFKAMSAGLIVLALQACASVPIASPQEQAAATQFQASPDKGVLYVYRKDQFQGGGVIYPIVVNGQLVGSLKAGTFLRTEIPPGQVQVSSFTTTAQSVIPLTVQAGEIKFISTAYHVSAGTVILGIAGNISLVESDEAAAKSDINALQRMVSR